MRALLFTGMVLSLASSQMRAAPIPWFESNGGNGHYYELIIPPGGTTWTMAHGASDKAEFLGLQGHLISINSEAEWEFITRSFPHNGTWIGLTDENIEGEFEWVTDETVTFSAWKYLEPDNAGDEDYAYYELGPAGWGWNDFADRRSLHGIEMPLAYLIEYPTTSVVGDFTQDNVLDVADIDLLATQTRTGNYNPLFDLTGDGQLDFGDRVAWVELARNTSFGDANLDEVFDSDDLVQVFVSGEYEDGIALNSTWAEGDWSGDFEFDTHDILIAFQSGGYRREVAAASLVPEPPTMALMWLGLLLLCRCRLR